jgi:hypothetical protein
MKKALFLIGTIVLTTAFKLTAQDSKAESQRLLDLLQKLEGTYQLQVIDSPREKIALPLAIMDSVQAKRHTTEIVYFPLKDNVRVMVLPFSEITKKDFKPLERIVNISSQQTK